MNTEVKENEVNENDETDVGGGFFFSLGKSLVLWFLLLSISPLVLLSSISYQQVNSSLTQTAIDKLTQSAKLNAGFVQNWFDYRFLDLESRAEADSTLYFQQSLMAGLRNADSSVSDYVGSYDWAVVVDQGEGDFISFWSRYDYVEDVLLLDNDGHILYSANRSAVLGENLIVGRNANSRFAQTVARTLKTGKSQFSDLERYPSDSYPASGFLVALLQNKLGEAIGVIAIQIQMHRIVEMLQIQRSESVVHYLVGLDGVLRTSRSENREAVLEVSIETERFRKQLNEEGKPFDESDQSAFEYRGPDGLTVIGIHQPVQLGEVSWVLINEVDRHYAMADATWLSWFILIMVVLVSLVVLLLAIYVGRRITLPIIQLSEATMMVAAGELDHKVDVTTTNEIGQLAKTFNHMLTVRHIHEQALEQSHQETRVALSNLEEQKYVLDQHSIVDVCDLEGKFSFVNAKFVDISGYTEEELLGQNQSVVGSGEHDSQFWDEMYRTLGRGDVWSAEVCNRAKDGKIYWVDTTIVPFSSNEQSKSYVAIRDDITERKRVEVELVDAKERAEFAALAKSDFLASMSHEIRTPMNGVLGMLRLLMNSGLSDEQYRKAFLAKSSAQSLLVLINDILDFSKVDAGKLELEAVNFNVLKLLGEFSEGIALRAQEKGLEIILDVVGIDQPMVKGDPGRLQQILTNLIGNSIKFTESGEIVIRVRLEVTSDDESILTCQVKDTGIGIPADKHANLFDQFTQVDASTTRHYGGTGLGLSIVKKLVELMGGSISVYSELGQGSRFDFSVILQTCDDLNKAERHSPVKGLRLLVVDDNATTRTVIRNQMEHWGAQVDEAENSESALRLLIECQTQSEVKPIDGVFLDMQLGDTDGLAVGQLIRADIRLNLVKLIMMTSMDQREDGQFFASHGFIGYFPKPATSSDLYDGLMRVADKRALVSDSSYFSNDSDKQETSQQMKWLDKCNLLLVEDNQINQEVALGMLDDLGLEADVAANGEEALSALSDAPSTEPYTLIFMDCQMPDMDGYEASRRIRNGMAGQAYQSIPIVAMTANAMKGDKEKCLEAGMSDYMTKPLEPEMLEEMLHRWLPVENGSRDVDLNNIDSKSIDSKSIDSKSIDSKNIDSKNSDQIPDSQLTVDSALEDTNGKLIWDKPAVLKRVGGKEKRLVKLVGLFFSAMPDRMTALQQAVDDDNVEEILHLAHSIKGVVANLGGLCMEEAALELEIAVKNNEMSSIERHMKQVDEAYDALTHCISSSDLNAAEK